MSEEQATQTTKAGAESQTITPESYAALQKKVEMMQNANNALAAEKDKLLELQKSHGAEMKAKKERERKALEEAGEYQKALEMLQKEAEEQKKAMQEFESQKIQWKRQQKQMALMLELQKPGRINPLVPPKDVLPHIDIDSIELDGINVKDFDVHYEKLLEGRDYLKPPEDNGNGQKKVSGMETFTTGKGQIKQATHEAKLLAKNVPGYSPETAEELLKNPEFKKMAQSNGWLREKPAMSELL